MTEQQQRILTEFLGECWHEPKTPTNECLHMMKFGATRFCSKCGVPIHPMALDRLDFTDWRIVGRIVEKVVSDGARGVDIMMDYCSVWLSSMISGDAFGGPPRQCEGATPQEAICLAVLAYLEDRK